jgi:hypothetical protein
MKNKETLPNDVERCSNGSCKERLNCKRFIAEKPKELYWESRFEERNCEFLIKC